MLIPDLAIYITFGALALLVIGCSLDVNPEPVDEREHFSVRREVVWRFRVARALREVSR